MQWGDHIPVDGERREVGQWLGLGLELSLWSLLRLKVRVIVILVILLSPAGSSFCSLRMAGKRNDGSLICDGMVCSLLFRFPLSYVVLCVCMCVCMSARGFFSGFLPCVYHAPISSCCVSSCALCSCPYCEFLLSLSHLSHLFSQPLLTQSG